MQTSLTYGVRQTRTPNLLGCILFSITLTSLCIVRATALQKARTCVYTYDHTPTYAAGRPHVRLTSPCRYGMEGDGSVDSVTPYKSDADRVSEVDTLYKKLKAYEQQDVTATSRQVQRTRRMYVFMYVKYLVCMCTEFRIPGSYYPEKAYPIYIILYCKKRDYMLNHSLLMISRAWRGSTGWRISGWPSN